MNQQEAVQLYLTAYKKAADTSSNAGEGHVFFDAQDLIGRSRQALAEQDRLRREQINRSFPDITRRVSEAVKQQEPVSDVRANAPVPVEVPYGRVIDAVDKAQRHADATRAPVPTRDEIARARVSTPRGKADAAVAQFLRKQRDADLNKMMDRATEESFQTDAFETGQRAQVLKGIFEARQQFLRNQSDADLNKMANRQPGEEAATAAYQRKQRAAAIQKQSDADLDKMANRQPGEEAATAAYAGKQRAAAIQKQSDADLDKMANRATEESIQTGTFEAGQQPKKRQVLTGTSKAGQQPKKRQVLGMSPLTAGLVGGGAVAALGGGTALLLALRKRAKKKREQAGSGK